MTSPLSIAVVGYGVIGRRVVSAVLRQKDMALVGVAARSAKPSLLALESRGVPIFAKDEDKSGLEAAGFKVHGGLEELLEHSQIVIDCTQRGLGVKHQPTYQHYNRKAIYQGGESHEEIGFSFFPSINFESAKTRITSRIPSCNAIGLLRVFTPLWREHRLLGGHAVIIRCASDPDKASKGDPVGITPSMGLSHHAQDLGYLLPELAVTSQAVSVPTNRGHVIQLMLQFEKPCFTQDVLLTLAKTPRVRIISSEDAASTTALRFNAYKSGRDNGDWYETLVWREGVVRYKEDMMLMTTAVHMEAITVPETIDCIRAMTRFEGSFSDCIAITDAALRIQKEGWH